MQVFFCEYYEAFKSTYYEAHLLTAGSHFLKTDSAASEVTLLD